MTSGLTVAQTARLLGISDDGVRQAAYRGKLKGELVPKGGGRHPRDTGWRFDPAEVERYRRENLMGTAK